MAGADVLSGGGDGPSRSRRWLVAAAILAVVLGIPAVRNGLRDRAPAQQLATPGPARSQSTVVSVAASGRWAYALVADCGTRILHDCDYRVRRRAAAGGAWQPLPLQVSGRTTTGLDVTMRVTADDRVLLVHGDSLLVSTAAGGTVRALRLHRGSPVTALPAGGVLASGLCGTCDDVLTALDPATGELRPLRSQPAFGGAGMRLTQLDGDVLWAAQLGPAGGLSAVSTDRGRSWRTIRLGPGMVFTDPVVLAPIPGGGAYLVGRRADNVPDVRRIDGPAGTWRQLRPARGPNAAYSAVVHAGGLLVGDGNGQAWRLGPDGWVTLPGQPGYLAGGPGGMLLGLPPTPGTVQVSYDGGRTWRSERVG